MVGFLLTEAPNITLTPAGGYAIKDNVTDSLEFTCTALLDEKVASASIHWRTNHTEKALRDMRITGKHDFGVKVSYLPCILPDYSTDYYLTS